MKYQAVISSKGEVLFTFQGDASYLSEQINGNKVLPVNYDILRDAGYLYYFDEESADFKKTIIEEGKLFNYGTRQWEDPRTLNEYKAQKWDEIKSERDSLEFGGFEFEGGIYDSDQVSQSRIMGAAVAGVDQVWTLADNTTVELSASELQQLYAALQAHIASVHERGRIARQLINEAETKEEVEAVQL